MKIDVFTDSELSDIDRIKSNLTGKIPRILEDIGVYVVSSVIENFECGGRPEKWKPLAPATLAHKKGTLTLIDAGLLKAGIMSWVDGNSAYVGPSGPSKPYARIQNLGGETGRDGNTDIPARPYLVLQDENHTFIRDFIRGEILI